MRVIVAGSRTINDFNAIKQAIKESEFVISEIVCGGANGVDALGEKFALENNIPIKYFLADWNNIKSQKVVVKYNKFGKPYNAIAGHWRNEEMAKYSNALILVWDGKSKGSLNMKKNAEQYGLMIYEKIIEKAS